MARIRLVDLCQLQPVVCVRLEASDHLDEELKGEKRTVRQSRITEEKFPFGVSNDGGLNISFVAVCQEWMMDLDCESFLSIRVTSMNQNSFLSQRLTRSTRNIERDEKSTSTSDLTALEQVGRGVFDGPRVEGDRQTPTRAEAKWEMSDEGLSVGEVFGVLPGERAFADDEQANELSKDRTKHIGGDPTEQLGNDQSDLLCGTGEEKIEQVVDVNEMMQNGVIEGGIRPKVHRSEIKTDEALWSGHSKSWTRVYNWYAMEWTNVAFFD